MKQHSVGEELAEEVLKSAMARLKRLPKIEEEEVQALAIIPRSMQEQLRWAIHRHEVVSHPLLRRLNCPGPSSSLSFSSRGTTSFSLATNAAEPSFSHMVTCTTVRIQKLQSS